MKERLAATLSRLGLVNGALGFRINRKGLSQCVISHMDKARIDPTSTA